jgi:hypothetical protein
MALKNSVKVVRDADHRNAQNTDFRIPVSSLYCCCPFQTTPVSPKSGANFFLSPNQFRICVQFALDAALIAIMNAVARASGFIPPFSLNNVQSSASDTQYRNQSMMMLREGETT